MVDDQNLTGYVQTLEEWTADGFDAVELEKVYDYGLDLVSQTGFVPDAVTPNNLTPKTSYYLYDGHGSVRALADDSGTITDSYTYDAFGIQLSQQVLNPDSGSLESIAPNNSHRITDNSYLYTGEYFDVDLGLYYLRARHMNPETGRFHTLDEYEGSLGEPLSLHKYMYAHANPVMGIDPSGHFTLAGLTQAMYIGGILGAITGSVSGYLADGWNGVGSGFALGLFGGLISGAVSYTVFSIGIAGYTTAKIGTLVGYLNAALASGAGDFSVQISYKVTTGRAYSGTQTIAAVGASLFGHGLGFVALSTQGTFRAGGVSAIMKASNLVVQTCRKFLDEAFREDE